jgi:4-hydroxybenzoate polyprenyltransferase
MPIARYYRLANLLSLDVVAGAVCSAIFFAQLFDQPLNQLALVILALSVWVVYTLDHLIDGLSMKGTPSGRRHYFHKLHEKKLKWSLFAAICMAACGAIFLPIRILAAGGIMLAIVALYVVSHQRLGWMKETLVSVLYTAGVILPSAQDFQPDASALVTVVAFWFVALLNLLIFSFFDYSNDVADGQTSAATILGRKRLKWIIWILFVCIAVLLSVHFSIFSIVLFVMALVQMLLLVFERSLRNEEQFRLAGDAAFFLPALVSLFR